MEQRRYYAAGERVVHSSRIASVVEMEREHALDLMLFIMQQVEESSTFRSWNLTLLEMTYYVLSSHSPELLYAPASEDSSKQPTADIHATMDAPGNGRDEAPPPPSERGTASSHAARSPRTPLGALGGMLLDRKAGREALLTQQTGRHGRFGGAFKVRSDFGTEHVLGRMNSSVCQRPPCFQRAIPCIVCFLSCDRPSSWYCRASVRCRSLRGNAR